MVTKPEPLSVRKRDHTSMIITNLSPDAPPTGLTTRTEFDAPDEIGAVEGEIERLVSALDRCRSLIRAGHIAVALGAAVLLLMLISVLRFNPATFVIAVAALIGGIPFVGSSRSTLSVIQAELRAAEVRRSEIIEQLGPEVVSS
jgi:predicted RNA binding protein with dsRBD fold (UPF0201 family)